MRLVRAWLFIRQDRIDFLLKGLKQLAGEGPLLFVPRITPLEMVQPWRYRSWNREGEAEKPESIPEEMRS